jgi:hypothetical protein
LSLLIFSVFFNKNTGIQIVIWLYTVLIKIYLLRLSPLKLVAFYDAAAVNVVVAGIWVAD